MATLSLETESNANFAPQRVHVGERLIGFERYLELGQKKYVDLIDGLIVEKAEVHLDHELCRRWLYQVLGAYIEELKLGELFNARIAVQTESFGKDARPAVSAKRQP